jgi:tetratricopeptide (TPR) repeat protein
LERFQTLKEKKEEQRNTRLKMPDPDMAQGQFDLGMLYRKCGRPAEATVRFYRAFRLGSRRAASLLPARSSPAHMERAAGLEAMRRKAYPLAINHYRTASQLEPANGLNYRNLGLAMRSLGQDGEAMKIYRKAIDLDRELAPAYNDLALLYAQNAEDYETAIQLLNQAIELDRDEKLFHFNLAHIHFTIGHFDAAIRENERVIELDSLSALTWFNLGMSYSRSGDFKKAEPSLRKALEINSSYADAFFELGKLYKAEGLLADAGEMYENCLKYQPQHKYAHYGLGQVYLKMGRREEARELLDRFAELRDHRKQQRYLFFAPPDSL